ncbi:alpha/beta hydrolase [Humibacillus xanthopallidus]|uniref:alpha/beta hydrolase n=1 Tax=Humibacillus xanthopallidus TaxID=412689 RepID=UPI00384CBDB1
MIAAPTPFEHPDASASPSSVARPDRVAATWSAVLGVVLLGAAVWLGVLSWDVLRAGHPAHLLALAATGVVGLVVLVRAVVLWRRPGRARAASRRSWPRLVGRGLAAVATVAVVGSLVWLVPFAASPGAVAAMAGTSDVRVTDAPTTITLTPQSVSATRGFVFQPGARVDPRAYVPILTEVSRSGVLVVIVKQPFDIGFLAINAPSATLEAHPEVTTWAVGGHSLGGVAASSYAGSHTDTVRGLVLWASYPLGSLAQSGLRVASVSGSADGLATPADIEASRVDLPGDTAYTVVEGGVHAFFGDYGEQPGDGTPGVSSEEAQRQIVDATVALIGSL